MNQSFSAIYFASIAFIFGTLVGSFLNVVIYRVPRNMNIAFPRSQCPECGTLIKWFLNIPILSFLFLRGKCFYCKTKIKPRYPIIEFIVGLVSLYLYPKHFSMLGLWNYIFLFSVFCVFLCHFLIDIEHYILPDSLNLYLAIIFLCNSLYRYHWKVWLFGGLIGFLFPFLISWAFYKLRGQIGLGGGDVKLYGALGIAVGPELIVQNLFLSSFFGSVFALVRIIIFKQDKNRPMPFGPFIIIVATMQLFFPSSYRLMMKIILDNALIT